VVVRKDARGWENKEATSPVLSIGYARYVNAKSYYETSTLTRKVLSRTKTTTLELDWNTKKGGNEALRTALLRALQQEMAPEYIVGELSDDHSVVQSGHICEHWGDKQTCSHLFKGLPPLIRTHEDQNINLAARRRRTAVSSTFRSSESIFPPGKDVSPAYVLSVADLLIQSAVNYLIWGDPSLKKHTDSIARTGHQSYPQIMQLAQQHVVNLVFEQPTLVACKKLNGINIYLTPVNHGKVKKGLTRNTLSRFGRQLFYSTRRFWGEGLLSPWFSTSWMEKNLVKLIPLAC